MSVQMQIDRISANISQTYSVLSDAGANIPETANSDNLPDTARSIKAVLYDRTQNLTDEQKAQARENIGAQPAGNYALKTEIPSVPVQSVNGKTGAVNLTASDVKARPDSWMPTAQDVGALPSTYTPPNQTAQQVGALAVSGGDMEGAINMNGQPISGLNDPTEESQAARKGYVDGLTRKAAHRNLLDNSDFRNPVNQRGKTSYSLSAWGDYCIDRWAAYANGGTVTIGSGGLTLSGNIFQPIASDITAVYNGKVLTLAVKIAGTVYCCSGEVNQTGAWHLSARFDTPYGYIRFETENSNMMFVIIDNSTTPSVVEWAALYEGAYTAETLPEYRCKGYGAELAECQRYYQIRSANNIAAVDMRPTMRLISPTITSVTGGYAYSADL